MTLAPPTRMTGLALALAAVFSGVSSGARAAEWYFYVQNNSRFAITRLEVRQSGGPWGSFDLAGGIAPGRTTRIDWAASTSHEDCHQSLRATFADGSTSAPTTFDFCSDLNTPIVFSD